MEKNSLQFNLNRLDEIVTNILKNCNNASSLYYCVDKMQEIIINNCLTKNSKFNAIEQQHFAYLCKYFKGVYENENNNTW